MNSGTINNSICPVLEPIKLATAMLSAEENVTLSVVLPMVAGLLRHTVTAEDDAEAVRQFKEEFRTQLTSRFKVEVTDNSSVTILHIVSFLDPRYCHMNFVSATTKAY
jgi:hypothetical protein